MALAAFMDYFRRSSQVWERMTLTRARVIFATGGFGRDVSEAVRSLLAEPVDPAHVAGEVISMRHKLEASRPRNDLKPWPGGLADLELISSVPFFRARPLRTRLVTAQLLGRIVGAAASWNRQCRAPQRAA